MIPHLGEEMDKYDTVLFFFSRLRQLYLRVFKVNCKMFKPDQNFLQQVGDLLQKERDLHRLMAYISMLSRKQKTAQNQLIQAEEVFRKACLSEEKEIIKENADIVMETFKTIYGLSKEKIQVCRQCTDLLQFLMTQLVRLKDLRTTLRKSTSFSKSYSSSTEEPQLITRKGRIKKKKRQFHGYVLFDPKQEQKMNERIQKLQLVVAKGNEMMNQL